MRQYFKAVVKDIKKVLGPQIGDITIRDLIERVYHLNGYLTNDPRDIIITETAWAKGNNKISSTPMFTT